MKKIILSTLMAFFSFLALNAQSSGGGSCSCTSIGCSASKHCSKSGYSCTCTCSLTICSCTQCSTSEHPVPPTVSAEQLENRQQLSSLLRSFGSLIANESADLLDESYKALINGDLNTYESKGFAGEAKLQYLTQGQKNAVNAWIESKGSDIRIQ